MPRRSRTFLGAVAMVLFVGVYALVVMALSQPFLDGASRLTQGVFYLIAGLAWIAPLVPLIRWMEGRPAAGAPRP